MLECLIPTFTPLMNMIMKILHWLKWDVLIIQFSSVAQSCPSLCDPTDCSTPGLPVHHQLPDLLKLMSVESVVPSDHLILCRPLLLLPSIFPSIRVFSKESALHIRWPEYWSFSSSLSPSNAYSGLIPNRMDWLDLLAVQGTLKSLLQHHSSKASILPCSAFFIAQLSHPYMTCSRCISFLQQEESKILMNIIAMRFYYIIEDRIALSTQAKQWI